MKSYTASTNWKRHQLRFLDADDIVCDYELKVHIQQYPDWQVHVEYASGDLKSYAEQHNMVNNQDFDFFIINDMEFGKLNLLELEHIIKDLYNRSRHGGYFSVQSYFLNWNNQSECCRADLDDNMDRAAVEWVERYLGVNTYTNKSLKISDPLKNFTADGRLLAGSDFMYTHGNIRFWLWKE